MYALNKIRYGGTHMVFAIWYDIMRVTLVTKLYQSRKRSARQSKKTFLLRYKTYCNQEKLTKNFVCEKEKRIT